MACGVHLGILLICLVQAEHVRCLWATQAQSSQRQNGNRYVGLLQQDGGQRLGGSYLQNQLRQSSVSAQSSSLNMQNAVNSGYSRQGLSSSAYKQTVSQPANSGHPSVRYVQGSSVSKLNWQPDKSNKANSEKVPKKQFLGLSTAIASGSSVSKYSKKQNDPTGISKRAWPAQQGTPRASKYASSSSASVQSPRNSYSFSSHNSAAQKAPSETPTYYGPRASAKSSSLFSAVAPAPQRTAVRMQTSATAPARRVSLSPSSQASKPSHSYSPQNGRVGSNPGQTEVGKPYQSKLFPVSGGNAQGSYRPTSMSKMASSQVSYSQSLPVSNKNAPVGFQPRSLQRPTNQRLSYTSTEQQVPSSASSLQASWNSRTSAQGAHNLPASGISRPGTSGKRFAPTRTHSIPQRFGGSPIRRLRDPVDQKEVSVRKPPPQQQTYIAPSQQKPSYQPQQKPSYQPQQKPSYQPQQKPSYQPQQKPSYQPQQKPYYQPQVQSVHKESKWKRFRPNQRL